LAGFLFGYVQHGLTEVQAAYFYCFFGHLGDVDCQVAGSAA
jgi:hypothetical protein